MRNTSIRILLVEDEVLLAERLSEGLRGARFAVDHAADGDLGWYLGSTTRYDAVVLDLGLPKMSGLEVLRRWRAAGNNTPVLMLTARATWTERVEGLNAGADDYLGKPFQIGEVVARLRALIRRARGGGGSMLHHGDLALDVAGGTLTKAGIPIAVTAGELKLLGYLLHRPSRVVSQSEIADHLYAFDSARDSNTIEVHVGRLRRKLGRDVIHTVRGLGYRLG
jgi:two-component system OmpR family response regulator